MLFILQKHHKSLFFLLVLIIFASSGTFISGCGKKSDDTGKTNSEANKNSGEFSWKDGLTSADIPDFPVKGKLNGKDVQFAYINFEKWRGPNDNVINFSMVKPQQNCGFIDNFEGFTLINKGNEIKTGQYLKSKFADDPATYSGSFTTGGTKSTDPWNCALEIESFDNKTVKGKIAFFFNDGAKSWVAGKFEAVICNN